MVIYFYIFFRQHADDAIWVSGLEPDPADFIDECVSQAT